MTATFVEYIFDVIIKCNGAMLLGVSRQQATDLRYEGLGTGRREAAFIFRT